MNVFGTDVIQISDLYLAQSKQVKGKRVPGRNHHSLSFRHSGHIRLHYNRGPVIESQKGMLTFVPQGWDYYHEVIEDSEITVLHFGSDELLNCAPFAFAPMDEKVFSILFNKAAEIWNGNPVNSSVSLLAAAYKIFETVIREDEEYSKSGNSRIALDAVRFLRRNFSNPELSISACAAAAGITEAYLRRIFRKIFDLSPGQYLLRIRMDNAKNLLSTGYYSVKEVALRSGFSGPSHFCSVFRNFTGFSPLAYMKGSQS